MHLFDAWCFLTAVSVRRVSLWMLCLNAPVWRLVLSNLLTARLTCSSRRGVSLNAPYGTRCFLTFKHGPDVSRFPGLNAPYGARCFLITPSRTRCLQFLSCPNVPYGADLAGLLENVACNLAFTPSRLEAAPLRCCGFRRSLRFELRELHVKFSSARCFLANEFDIDFNQQKYLS